MSLTVNDVPCAQAELSIPYWGIWSAVVQLAEPKELRGEVTLRDGNAELKGTIVSGGVVGGLSNYRIVGGKAGWRKEITAKSYQNAAGCTFSSVVNDLAAEVGETAESPPRTALGPHYARPGSTQLQAVRAADILTQHMPRAWHVGDDGVTRFAPRTGAEYQDSTATIHPPSDLGVVLVECQTAATLRPGVKIDGQEIGDVRLLYGAKRISAYCRPKASAQTDLVGQIADRALAKVRFLGCYEYEVTAADSAKLLNLEPTDADLGLPLFEKTPVRSDAGYSAEYSVGSLVILMFINGNPARPIVIGAAESSDNDSQMVTLGVASRAEALSIASKCEANHDKCKQYTADLQSWADTHTHVTSCGSGPGSTNPPLPPSSASAIPPVLESVAAENVKGS